MSTTAKVAVTPGGAEEEGGVLVIWRTSILDNLDLTVRKAPSLGWTFSFRHLTSSSFIISEHKKRNNDSSLSAVQRFH